MSKGTLRLAAALVAIVCAGIGFAIGKFTSVPADTSPKIVEIPAPAVNSGIPDQIAKIDALMAKLAAAERRIAELAATGAVAAAAPEVVEEPAPEAEARREPRRRESREERMARCWVTLSTARSPAVGASLRGVSAPRPVTGSVDAGEPGDEVRSGRPSPACSPSRRTTRR